MRLRTLQVIAAVCTALLLASCGQDEGDPIPQSRADRLEGLLQQVQRQSDATACTTLLEKTIPTLEREAKRLPSKVGEDTQTTIEDGVAHLRDLAETDCAEQQQEELPTTEESTSTETTPSTTTDTEPSTSTDTTPSTSTDTTPSTSTETTPPDTAPPEATPGNGGTPPGQGGTPPGLEP